jgi:CBS domain-containing protein
MTTKQEGMPMNPMVMTTTNSGVANRRTPRDEGGLVRDRMTAPVIRVQAMASASRVARLLESRKISAVPVIDQGQLVGIVSTTDILRSRLLQRDDGDELAAARVRVNDIMTSPVVITHPEEPIDGAAWRMVAARVHRLVVVDSTTEEFPDREPVRGILSARDVLEELMTRRLKTPVREIMSTPVESIAIGDPTHEAIHRLIETNVHGLVVVDGLAPIGVFTHQEALAARRLPRDLRSCPVEEMMSFETICMDASTPIWRAAAYAVATNVRRLLICESKHLVGIASLIDLVSALSRAEE